VKFFFLGCESAFVSKIEGASECDDTHCEYPPADFREERWVFVEKEVSLDVF